MGAFEFGDQPPSCTGDLNGDGVVSLADLSELLSNFGTSSSTLTATQGDLDCDLDVDLDDLTTILAVFGTVCG